MDSTNLRDDLMFSCLVATLVTGDHPASPGLVAWCRVSPVPTAPWSRPAPHIGQLLLCEFSDCCVWPDGGAINMQIM